MARRRLFDTPAVMRLQAVIESIGDGVLLFPEFQRDFVWSDEQRLRLMDSVLKGLPIGSILVWRTNDMELAVKTDLLPEVTPDVAPDRRNFVLDGLQRLMTLFRALGPSATSPNDRDVRWPIFFDLATSLDEGDEDRFHLSPSQKSPPPTWLPLNGLFAAERLYQFQKVLIDHGRPDLANKAERLANAFKDYELPLIPLLTDSLEQAAQSFERVNSQGSKMGEGEMLRALTYRQHEFDLSAKFDEITENLRWDNLDHQIYVNTLKVLMEMSVYRAQLPKIVELLKSTPMVLDLMKEGFNEAVDFLYDECGVRGEWALPYAYQLVALARLHVQLALKSDPALPRGLMVFKLPLRAWFWATTYGEYFSHMTGTQLQSAFAHLDRVCLEGVDPIPVDLMRQEIPELERLYGGSVRALARAHLLAQQPLVDEVGRPIDGKSILQWGSKGLHKLFPDRPASDPANRFLASPDNAREVRNLLTNPHLTGLSPMFYEGHLLDPPQPGQSVEAVLERRRSRLREVEGRFVATLRLSYRAVGS